MNGVFIVILMLQLFIINATPCTYEDFNLTESDVNKFIDLYDRYHYCEYYHKLANWYNSVQKNGFMQLDVDLDASGKYDEIVDLLEEKRCDFYIKYDVEKMAFVIEELLFRGDEYVYTSEMFQRDVYTVLHTIISVVSIIGNCLVLHSVIVDKNRTHQMRVKAALAVADLLSMMVVFAICIVEMIVMNGPRIIDILSGETVVMQLSCYNDFLMPNIIKLLNISAKSSTSTC